MRKGMIGILAAAMTCSMNMTALAGQWQLDSNGWWWQNDDGSYLTNAWQWIDGNYDGTAECYYFNENGYALLNTSTPDGYQVNSDGAWIENGIVKTQPVNMPQSTENGKEVSSYDGIFAGPRYNSDGTTFTAYITIETLPDGSINVTDVGGTFNFKYSGPFYGEGGGEVYAIENEEMKESIIFRGFHLLISGGEEFVRVQ